MTQPTSVHDFELRTISGGMQSLAEYRGQVLLLVNVASRCGFTPQYEGLETLHERYHARGFSVLGFPANDFLGQEPGTEAEIAEFCSTTYGVTFPMFGKIHVKGGDMHPLYAWLTEQPPAPGKIDWNFAKFLVGRDGRVVARFGPRVAPLDAKVIAAVEGALATG